LRCAKAASLQLERLREQQREQEAAAEISETDVKQNDER
jgi:hypothetical protein